MISYRKDIYLACKTAERTRPAAEKEMLESMKLLHTDYFDVYQMHGLESVEEVETAFGPNGVMEMMVEMKEKGIARKLGFTAHSEQAALRALELYDFDTVLFPFNWHMHMQHGMGKNLIAVAKERGMGVLCMKSMIERAWIDGADEEGHQKYPKSWCKPFDVEKDSELLTAAIKYVFSIGVDAIIPPGNFDHFHFGVENIEEILKNPFSAEDEKTS